MFIDANPGLRSRFPKTIFFPDYTDDELVADLRRHVPQEPVRPDGGGPAAVLAFLAAQARDQGFGNGRLARNLFEAAVARQASRVVARPEDYLTDAALVAIEAVDIPRRRRPAVGVPTCTVTRSDALMASTSRSRGRVRPVPHHRPHHLALDDGSLADHRLAAGRSQVGPEVAGRRAAVDHRPVGDDEVEVDARLEVAARRPPTGPEGASERSRTSVHGRRAAPA